MASDIQLPYIHSVKGCPFTMALWMENECRGHWRLWKDRAEFELADDYLVFKEKFKGE